jgi:hypothetical protein
VKPELELIVGAANMGLLQSVDAACGKVVFCDEHGEGFVFAKATTGQGVLEIN